MNNQEFEIECFNLRPSMIDVTLCRNYHSIDISIPRSKYEFYLLINDKLGWRIEKRDTEGVYRVEEVEGVMSYQEYWQLDKELINEDFYQYIMTNQIMYAGTVYSHNTKSILNSFKK